jgi:hypothetical protein
MTDKAQLEAANWAVAHTWAEGLGLEFGGIDLSDLTVYNLLMVLGRIQLSAQEIFEKAQMAITPEAEQELRDQVAIDA